MNRRTDDVRMTKLLTSACMVEQIIAARTCMGTRTRLHIPTMALEKFPTVAHACMSELNVILFGVSPASEENKMDTASTAMALNTSADDSIRCTLELSHSATRPLSHSANHTPTHAISHPLTQSLTSVTSSLTHSSKRRSQRF